MRVANWVAPFCYRVANRGCKGSKNMVAYPCGVATNCYQLPMRSRFGAKGSVNGKEQNKGKPAWWKPGMGRSRKVPVRQVRLDSLGRKSGRGIKLDKPQADQRRPSVWPVELHPFVVPERTTPCDQPAGTRAHYHAPTSRTACAGSDQRHGQSNRVHGCGHAKAFR